MANFNASCWRNSKTFRKRKQILFSSSLLLLYFESWTFDGVESIESNSRWHRFDLPATSSSPIHQHRSLVVILDASKVFELISPCFLSDITMRNVWKPLAQARKILLPIKKPFQNCFFKAKKLPKISHKIFKVVTVLKSFQKYLIWAFLIIWDFSLF